jgi:transcriptional regulator with XRE-family HTH domain
MLGTEYTTIGGIIEGVKQDFRIGKRMREIRKAAGLTQTEVAARMGCTQKDVSRWESGRQISTPNIYLFCKAVGCSLGVFDDL